MNRAILPHVMTSADPSGPFYMPTGTHTLGSFYFILWQLRCINTSSWSHTLYLLAVADSNLRFQIPKAACTCDLTIFVIWKGCGGEQGRVNGQGADRW